MQRTPKPDLLRNRTSHASFQATIDYPNIVESALLFTLIDQSYHRCKSESEAKGTDVGKPGGKKVRRLRLR